MPITVNNGGVLRTLGKVSVNDSGVIRNLNTVHVNDSGVLRQVFSAGTPISDVNVGNKVHLKNTSGGAYSFIVVHKGKPSSIYDDSCDGIWVIKETPLTPSAPWYDGSPAKNYYPYSDCEYWGSKLYGMIHSAVKPAIKTVKIPYYKANSTSGGKGSVQSGSNGSSCRGFILSAKEVGYGGGLADGARLSYFSTSARRICYYGGEGVPWWTRTPDLSDLDDPWYVHSIGKDGTVHIGSYCGNDVSSENFKYFRPAFVLSYSAGVDKNGYIIV
ncbi:MAG: hypothetical protein K2J77_03275 [Oscillospiraceae bacterium]|nr:hypothetical protein [Oscillospiraceae bacterium]